MPTLILDAQDGSTPLRLDWTDGYAVQDGPTGLGLAPRALVLRKRAGVDGAEVRRVEVGPRDVSIPVDVFAKTRPQFLAMRRRLQLICASRSPIQLTHVEDDGPSYSLLGHYVGGLEGNEGRDQAGSTWSVHDVVLRCGDPYWHMDPVRASWSLAAPSTWFPIFPLRLSASAVQGRKNVVNPGDVEVPGLFTVTGPGSRVDLVNHSLLVDTPQGPKPRTISVIYTLGDAQTLTIDTRPGSRGVFAADGTDLSDRVVSDPEFWSLRAGTNDVEATLIGANQASRIDVDFTPKLEAV